MHELGFLSRLRVKFPNDLSSRLPQWPLELAAQRFSASHHGDYARWQAAIDNLPTVPAPCRWQGSDIVSVALPEHDSAALRETLQQLHPWRKGPFRIGDVFIDTEWRSDWKWQRIAQHVQLRGRVLDIGGGNGYFAWRMLAAGAQEVITVDPTLLFCMQHQAINHFVQSEHNWVLPLGIEDIPTTTCFDSVFSMGVLYHRKDPQAHVQQMYELCAPGAQAVLESLVVQTPQNLHPADRYARMRNVWCVPTTSQMQQWMHTAGFRDTAIIDITPTTIDEQRSTNWMRFESLDKALDPVNSDLTIEGHPAPIRAVVVGYRR